MVKASRSEAFTILATRDGSRREPSLVALQLTRTEVLLAQKKQKADECFTLICFFVELSKKPKVK